MKFIVRLIVLAVLLGGWTIASMAVHVVRTPDPANPNQSTFVIVPKSRLAFPETYVDARVWTLADLPQHTDVAQGILRAGKADRLKYLLDPKSREDAQTQIRRALHETDGIAPVRGKGPARPIQASSMDEPAVHISLDY